VVKPAAPAVMATGVYAGQTLPDSGLPMLLLDGSGIAAVAGLKFQRAAATDDVIVAEAATGIRALLFDDLDGQRRVMPLAAIDRVETVSTDAIRLTGGRLRLAIGGALVPLHAVAAFDRRHEVAVLRLTDGVCELAYAIAEATEIVILPAEIAPARGAGPIAGVVIVGDEQVEVVDAHALFAAEERPAEDQPLCWLQGDGSGWMETFLKPTLEAAGYRCVTQRPVGETASVALAMDDADPAASDAPLVRLRRELAAEPDDTSIYRYDRPALIAALADVAGGR
jgi:two-component system chemotaxis sensor kinase CheA